MAPFNLVGRGATVTAARASNGRGVRQSRVSEAMIASHPSVPVCPALPLKPSPPHSRIFLYSVNGAKLNCAITIAVNDGCQIGIEFDPIG